MVETVQPVYDRHTTFEGPPRSAPGPPPAPLLGWRGNALRFFRNPIAYMVNLREAHGDVARLSQGSNPALMFRSRRADTATYFAFGPECTRRIVTDTQTFETRDPRGPQTETFRRICTNFFFTNGDRHKQQRRLMMPAFNKEAIRVYYGEMVSFTERMLERWQHVETIDLDEEMCNLTMNIASKTLYGLDPARRDQDLAELMVRMVNALFSPVTMIPVDLPGTPYRRLVRHMELITRRLQTEIERKRARGAGDPDILSMMVRAHDEDPDQLSDDELIGQAFVVFFAGHDTSAKALVWTLFLLAQHPGVMGELLDELEANLRGAPPTFEQVFALPCLERVVKESLRILSPAVMFAREATRTTTLGPYEIPEGSEVIYSPYVSHVDPDVFRQPRRFLPQRWLDIKPTAYEYLPFGAGSRTCLGVHFAGLQLRLVVAMILQRFRLQVAPDTRIDIKTNVVISPKNGLPMLVHSQDRQFHKSKSDVKGYIREMVELD